MAHRAPPTPHDADNSCGSLPATRNVWRRGDADSMSARDIHDPTRDAGFTTAGSFTPWSPIGQALAVVGESTYDS